MEEQEKEAQQLIVDFYGCDRGVLNNIDGIRNIVHVVCEKINTQIVEECYHEFQPIGISAFAVISTSHFSIHTWPEHGYAAVDIFSCRGGLTEEISSILSDLLKSKEVRAQIITRRLKVD